MRAIETEKDLDELRRMSVAMAAIVAWSSSGLFAALADGEPRAIRELPGDPRALEITGRVLLHAGLLVRSGDGFALSHAAQSLLQSGVFARIHAVGMMDDLGQLDRILREGGPVKGADGQSRATDIGVREDDPQAARKFMEFLFRRSGVAAEEVARALAPRLAKGARVVDLGGGHGRYAHALSERGLAVTLFDKALIVELARERYGDALTYRSGNFHRDELGGPYDAALISNIVHGLGPEEIVTLFERIRGALAPGGLVLVKDYLLDDLHSFPEHAAFFGVQMLLYTERGRTYPMAEVVALGERAGFEQVDVTWVPDESFVLLPLRRKE